MTPYDPAPASGALDVLCDPILAPLFRLPDRRGINSAWWGHVPFAYWLVAAARPRRIVELGSFAGVSYFAFCQAVLTEGLVCACHAVDTWRGDAHGGRYAESIYDDFRRFNDLHYAAISTMHRCTFDEALPRFADGSVDLLHIDGLHTYDAVKHDFETWLPKLSSCGVVLFHDANEHLADFGVWRFWEEVSARWPGFLFLHSHGLGVLAAGTEVPAAVRELCGASPARTAILRERFGLLGDRWYAQAQWEVSEQGAAEAAAIRASLFWRVTAPLRAARRVIRRLLGAAR